MAIQILMVRAIHGDSNCIIFFVFARLQHYSLTSLVVSNFLPYWIREGPRQLSSFFCHFVRTDCANSLVSI